MIIVSEFQPSADKLDVCQERARRGPSVYDGIHTRHYLFLSVWTDTLTKVSKVHYIKVMEQMSLCFKEELKETDCDHQSGFMTLAYVPGGYFCTDCNTLVFRLMPPTIRQPDEIGYITADWAWRYSPDSPAKSWTNDYEKTIQNG